MQYYQAPQMQPQQPPQQPPPQQRGAPPQQQPPQTTGQFIGYILKQFPRQLWKTLPLTLLIGVGSWLLHTYILIGPNGGFDPYSWYGTNILNTSANGRLAGSSILWGTFGMLLSSIVMFIKNGGKPGQQIAGFFRLPGDIMKANKDSGGRLLPAICIAAGVSLGLSSTMFSWVGAMLGGIITGSAVTMLTGRGNLFIQFAQQIAKDIQKSIMKSVSSAPNNNNIMVILGTSGFIMTLMSLGRIFSLTARLAAWITNYLWIPLIAIGIVLLFVNKGSSVPKQFMFLVCLFGVGCLLWSFGTTALADDGGWAEAGGTFEQWIASQGAKEAMMYGVPPAIAAIIGNLLAAILSGMPYVTYVTPEMLIPQGPQPPYQPQEPRLPPYDPNAGPPEDLPDIVCDPPDSCEL